jgi:Glycine zipper
MTQITQKAVAFGCCCALVGLALAGCAPLEQQVSEHPGTAVGAGAGAAGGALLGGLIFQSTTGAVIGGLVGGLTGGLIGNAAEAQKQDQDATYRRYGYQTAQGTRVRIEEVHAQPSHIRPGENVNLVVQYAIMTPREGHAMTVAERWDISHRGQATGSPVHTVHHSGGTWAGALPVTLPPSASPGTYHVAVTVEAEGASDTRETTFTVRR